MPHKFEFAWSENNSERVDIQVAILCIITESMIVILFNFNFKLEANKCPITIIFGIVSSQSRA